MSMDGKSPGCDYCRADGSKCRRDRCPTCCACQRVLSSSEAPPTVRVLDMSGDGSGPWRLFIGDHGVADWPCAASDTPDGQRLYAEEVARCVSLALPSSNAGSLDAPPCGEGNVDKTTCILVQGHDGTHYDGIGYWAGTSALKKKVSPIDPTDACATAFARPTEEDKDRARRFLAVNGTMTQGDPQSEAIVAALIRNIRVETERGRSKATPETETPTCPGHTFVQDERACRICSPPTRHRA